MPDYFRLECFCVCVRLSHLVLTPVFTPFDIIWARTNKLNPSRGGEEAQQNKNISWFPLTSIRDVFCIVTAISVHQNDHATLRIPPHQRETTNNLLFSFAKRKKTHTVALKVDKLIKCRPIHQKYSGVAISRTAHNLSHIVSTTTNSSRAQHGAGR